MPVAPVKSPSESPLRVLLAHPHALLREGLDRILREGGCEVVGQTNNTADLKQLIVAHSPDVVLLDWELTDGGVEATESLVSTAEQKTRGVVAVLTGPQTMENFSAARKSGVGGYLSINLSPDEFINALRMLAEGDIVVSREVAVDIKSELTATEANRPADDLSGREREVLNLVSRGATNQEIAGNLTITQNTVKVHMRRILEKLNLRNRQHAAAYAAQEGLVEDVLEDVEPTGRTE